MGLCDIFKGLERIPQELVNVILLQRCEEFNRTQTASEESFMAPLERIPRSIGTVFHVLARFFLLVLVAVFLRSVGAALVALVIESLFAECSSTAPLKPISGFLWRPPQRDKLFLTVYRRLYPDEDPPAHRYVSADPPKAQSDVALALEPPQERFLGRSET